MRMQMRRRTRPDERLRQEVGESLGRALSALPVLQLLPHPPDDSRYPVMQAGITDRVWDVAELLS